MYKDSRGSFVVWCRYKSFSSWKDFAYEFLWDSNEFGSSANGNELGSGGVSFTTWSR